MTTPAATPFRPPPERKTCRDCHRVYYSWGAHAEECSGPIMPVAPPPARETCGCPDGMMHRPLCPLVTGKDAA